MTLKSIHLVFVAAVDLLTIFFGVWAFMQYNTNNSITYLIAAIVSFLLSAGVILYGISFNKKIKI